MSSRPRRRASMDARLAGSKVHGAPVEGQRPWVPACAGTTALAVARVRPKAVPGTEGRRRLKASVRSGSPGALRLPGLRGYAGCRGTSMGLRPPARAQRSGVRAGASRWLAGHPSSPRFRGDDGGDVGRSVRRRQVRTGRWIRAGPVPYAVMPAQAGTHGRPAGGKQRPPVPASRGDGTGAATRSRSSSAGWRWRGSGPRRSPRQWRTGSTCWLRPARTRRWCGCRVRARGR
jgi:hypothetical protein